MVENAWRKVVFIVVLLALALFLWADWGVMLGLDLRGGARLVYRLDIDAARKSGQIDPNTSNRDVLTETVTILQNRIDPQGVLEANINPEGNDRILIELPGKQESEIKPVRDRIQQLGKLEWRLVIDDSNKKFDLPEEKRRLEDWLKKPENQQLIGLDPENISVFNSLPADKGGPKQPGKIRWIPMDPNADPATSEVRVPIQWKDPKTGKIQKGLARYIPVDLTEVYFTGEDLKAGKIRQTQDRYGLPAVAFELKESKKAEFTDFTARNKQRPFAIILNGKCRSAPIIQERLPGSGIITGGSKGFSGEEVRNLIITLKTGALKVKPILESESTLGPTLGETAIRTGVFSMIVGGAAVVLFMLLFYRLAGLVAVISLFVNMTYLMGAMALFRFTLTLPGMAGLVLTVGMAVDGNILIFERIREEQDKGKVLVQAIKNGFQMALSTIVDANVTTLITAIILYQVGTGPIRGFAVTLSIGILTSMFAALVVSKVLFHLLLEFGVLKDRLKMGRIFTNPNYPFLAYRKVAMSLSAAAMAIGLFIFLDTDAHTKLGIDFTGGASMRIVLKEPHDIDLVRKKITQAIPGAIVNTLGGSLGEIGEKGTPHVVGHKAQTFAVKFKLSPEQVKAFTENKGAAASKPSQAGGKALPARDLGAVYKNKLREALKGWLVSTPTSNKKIIPSPDGTYTIVQFVLHAEKPVRISDLKKALAGFSHLSIVPARPEDKGKKAARDFKVTMDMEAGIRPADIDERLASRLKGVKTVDGTPIALTEPFPEFEMIGARVVGELQTSAILAIILSLFAVIMYIRVRFHEYKYGFAAVLALVHDVTIALGAVVLVNRLGLVSAEIDLPLIAAFLTIIGYSLNDTIVVFDRIRENLPRMPGTYEQIINDSINQTLSRTIWTSFTTFMVLLAIFVFNVGQRNVLEGFSFAMLVGVVVGTYSSIFIASPILVMLHKGEQKKA